VTAAPTASSVGATLLFAAPVTDLPMAAAPPLFAAPVVASPMAASSVQCCGSGSRIQCF
jgi:hypothetical protein